MKSIFNKVLYFMSNFKKSLLEKVILHIEISTFKKLSGMMKDLLMVTIQKISIISILRISKLIALKISNLISVSLNKVTFMSMIVMISLMLHVYLFHLKQLLGLIKLVFSLIMGFLVILCMHGDYMRCVLVCL